MLNEVSGAASNALIVEALRQINHSLEAMNAKQAVLGSDVHNLATEVAVMKERDLRYGGLERELAQLRADMIILRSDKDRRDGALRAGGWITANWMHIVSLIFVLAMAGYFVVHFGTR